MKFVTNTEVTEMIMVYKMTNLNKLIAPLFEGHYDIRMVKVGMLTMMNKKFEEGDLLKRNPLKMKFEMSNLLDAINSIPNVSKID